MSDSLLGLPLEQALQELADRGVARVAVERLLAPRREADRGQARGAWRVVRVREGEFVTLDVCCFARADEGQS